jgi:hypothetical protein
MRDQKVSAWRLGAGAAWIGSGALLGFASAVDRTYLFALAVMLTGVAATLTIRCMLCAIAESLQAAFDLGAEAGRREARVPLQRVP